MPKLSNRVREEYRPFCSAVVLTAADAGLGAAGLDRSVGGMPILARSLRALERSAAIHEIVIVTQGEKIPGTAKLCRDYGILKATKILVGGETWMESALAGLSEISPKAALAAIHDAACALIAEDLIGQTVHAASLSHAAAPAVREREAVKDTSGDGPAVTVKEAVRVQSPEVFIPELIKAALARAVQAGETAADCADACERMGFAVRYVEGDEGNIRIRTPQDIAAAEYLIDDRGYGW